jgi:peptide/nickel transport system permease protein
MLSAILYGLRISIAVALIAVIMSCILGSLLGAAAGAFGGWTDAIVMRAADLQLAFPALLTALLIEGVIAAATGGRPDAFGFWTVAFSIGLSYWAQYARAVRSAAIAESTKDYVLAARMSGMSTWRLLTRELLPNVAVPLAPIAAVNFACAIMAEATCPGSSPFPLQSSPF